MKYVSVMIGEGHHADAWRWLLIPATPETDEPVAEGVADTEYLAEEALRAVANLFEGGPE